MLALDHRAAIITVPFASRDAGGGGHICRPTAPHVLFILGLPPLPPSPAAPACSLMESVLTIAAVRNACHFVNVASISVLIYDYFLTLELEIELIWRARWTIGKMVFLLARYPTFIDVPLTLVYSLNYGMPHKTCNILNYYTSWSTAFGIGMAEVIMILRTVALYNNSNKILIFLTMQFVAIYAPVVVILTLFLRSVRHGPPPLQIIRGCYPISNSKIVIVNFALLILNETIIMVLTLWVGVKRYRHSRNRLVVILYRDGILYFVYIFIISAIYIIVLTVCPPEYTDLLNTFQRVMHSVIGTRILLHMRNIVREVRKSGTNHLK